MKPQNAAQPAIFYDVDGTHKADTCENLKAAKARGKLYHCAYAHGCYPGLRMPAKMLPELCVACVWDANVDQTWGLPKHRNEGIEFGYLTRSKLDFIVEDTPHLLTGGDLTITRPWQPHQVGNPLIKASRMHWLILDVGVRRPNDPWIWPDWINLAPHDRKRLTELLSHNEQVVWQGNPHIEKCFEKIAEYTQIETPETVQSRLMLYLNEMLQKTNIELNSRLSSTRRSVEMFLQGLILSLDPGDHGQALQPGTQSLFPLLQEDHQHDRGRLSRALPHSKGQGAPPELSRPQHYGHRLPVRLHLQPVFRHGLSQKNDISPSDYREQHTNAIQVDTSLSKQAV